MLSLFLKFPHKNSIFKCSTHTWEHSNFSGNSIGIFSLDLSSTSVVELKELNWIQRAPAVQSKKSHSNTKPFPLDWEIWVEGPRSDSSTEPKLKVSRRGAPPDPSSFEGPREEMRDGAPEYPSHSLLRDQRQHNVHLSSFCFWFASHLRKFSLLQW